MESLVKHILKSRGAALPLALIPALLFFAGCGSDSGTSTGPIDNVLRVISITPQNNEVGTDPTAQIQIRMSMPVATSTINGLLKVSTVGSDQNTGAQIPINVSFAEGDTVIVGSPSGNIGQFGGNSQFKIELLQGVQSVTGQALAGTFTSFFSTGQGFGAGSTSKPGVPPTVTSWVPDSSNIWYCPNGTQSGIMVTVIFSECVMPEALAGNLEVDFFGAPVQYQVFPTFDERRFNIVTAPFFDIGHLDIKIRAGMPDCTGDLLVHDAHKGFDLWCL